MFKQRHPPHWYQDNTTYFITSRTVNAKKYFNDYDKKNIIYNILREGIKKFKIDLYTFVILDNHYHLLFKIKKGLELSGFMGYVNGKSSKILNEIENKQGRKVWYQYWDRCIRNEKDFFLHFNYEHHNPVKHGYVKLQEEVLNYKFCSYKNWINEKGAEWMNDCFTRYSIKDITIDYDEF
ncbi:transposase [Candidatus Parcubacteria bacterium]|nr:transposase [Candidatus Parcubacteria bacterium]